MFPSREEPNEMPEEPTDDGSQVEQQSVTAAVISNLDTDSKVKLAGWSTFFIVWFGLGIAGLIMSMVCLHRDGATPPSLTGIFVALLLGPIYWVYFGILKEKGQYFIKQ